MKLGRWSRRALKQTELTLETYGWRSGSFGNKAVGFCLVGAVRHSTRNPLVRGRIYRALYRNGARVPGQRAAAETEVMLWNDLQLMGGGTEERVLEKIRRTLGEEP